MPACCPLSAASAMPECHNRWTHRPAPLGTPGPQLGCDRVIDYTKDRFEDACGDAPLVCVIDGATTLALGAHGVSASAGLMRCWLQA